MMPASVNDRSRRPRRGAVAAAAAAAASWAAAAVLLALQGMGMAAAADSATGLPSDAVEELFRATLNAETARSNLRVLTSVPHQAGSVGDFELAKVRCLAWMDERMHWGESNIGGQRGPRHKLDGWMGGCTGANRITPGTPLHTPNPSPKPNPNPKQFVQRRFQEYGLPIARVEAFPALLSYPGARRPELELVSAYNASSVLFAAGLAEPVLEEDPTSDTPWRNHTYLGYSPAGEATAELVYANFGLPEDFDVLADAGVEVAGRIVIVRYGRCFRGLKVKNAQDRGALGVLIYSDPAEDGYQKGTVYPEGPWRPEFGVQRGSSAFMSLCTGDPARAGSAQSVKEVCSVEMLRGGAWPSLLGLIPPSSSIYPTPTHYAHTHI